MYTDTKTKPSHSETDSLVSEYNVEVSGYNACIEG